MLHGGFSCWIGGRCTDVLLADGIFGQASEYIVAEYSAIEQ